MNDEAQATTTSTEPTPVVATTTPVAEDSKRKAVAEHDWINAAGDVVDQLELATGIKYRDKATNTDFTFQIPGAIPGEVKTMFAVWGGRTKATNTASAARTKRKSDSTFLASDVDHMIAKFGEIKDGQWEAEGGGRKGPQYDLEVLADAIYAHLTAPATLAALQAAGQPAPDRDRIRKRLGDDVPYRNGAIKMPAILEAYQRAKGVTTATIESLNA